MNFSHFADIPVIDGHMHFMHVGRIDGMVKIMETVPYIRVNLLSMPSSEWINDNPSLIHFKLHQPESAYISGALDYTQVFADREGASENLARQVKTLKAIGFDGLKMHEGKPTQRQWIGMPVDAPKYEEMWSTLEELDMPVLFHNADPEEFWDDALVPDWAREHGWFFGEGDFPTKQALYAEIDHVLERHPKLKMIFAHFYFLSADLARAGKFLDAHPNVFFDLTPGSEMYHNFVCNWEAAREFFLHYQDRLIYGTDIMSGSLDNPSGMTKSLGIAWIVRGMLETDEVFMPPQEMSSWLRPDLNGFRGLNLPLDALRKIYRTNFEGVYGTTPVSLNREAAIVEMERMSTVLDIKLEGKAIENQARQVLKELNM